MCVAFWLLRLFTKPNGKYIYSNTYSIILVLISIKLWNNPRVAYLRLCIYKVCVCVQLLREATVALERTAGPI